MINNKMRVYFTLVICTLLVGLLVLFNSYAYWRVSDNQSDSNTVLGACLNIDLEEETNGNNVIDGLAFSNAYPLTDEQGANQTGYTFTIVNNCKVDTKYEVVLESLKINGFSNEDYLKDEYFKIQIDDGMIRRYSQLTEVDNTDPDNINKIKYVFSGTIPAKQGDEPTKESHTIKFWIASDATTNDAQNKQFKSRVNVIAGQNIVTAPDYKVADASCFKVSSNGLIYNTVNANNIYETCGTDIVFPESINGILITKTDIGSGLFSDLAQGLTSLDISGMYGLTNISRSSFDLYVGKDTDLIIPENVETIDQSAFFSFAGNSIIFSPKLKTIGKSAFAHYNGQEILLPETVTEIGENAFQSYQGLNTNLVIPSGVKNIKNSSFSRYKGDSISLPSGLETIEIGAFAAYNGSDIVIPSTIRSIGSSAFLNMDSSKTIYINKPNLDGIELGANWNGYGNAKVKCLVSENTYEDCPSS